MNKGFDSRLDQGWWALRIGLGLGPLLAGLDKYFNLLTNWTGYISPWALKILPFSGQTFVHIVGVIEMIVGLAILTKWTRLGAYVASVWLVLIAINLVSTGMGHPSRPRAITCCFFASLKTLLIPTKATALRRNQRPRASFSLAGFQVTLIGRFWVTAEGFCACAHN